MEPPFIFAQFSVTKFSRGTTDEIERAGHFAGESKKGQTGKEDKNEES